MVGALVWGKLREGRRPGGARDDSAQSAPNDAIGEPDV